MFLNKYPYSFWREYRLREKTKKKNRRKILFKKTKILHEEKKNKNNQLKEKSI